MRWEILLEQLFGISHTVCANADFLSGMADFDGQRLAIFGTTDHSPIGVALALRQARFVLDTMHAYPASPVLILVDTQGQQLRRGDELVGINRAMSHLGCCLDLARRRGHRLIGLVYDQALSGGFISSGLMADDCYALPDAEIRVMGIPAMARITKLSEQHLADLSRVNPVFAPGVANYVAMGGVRGVWQGDMRDCLREAMARTSTIDERAHDGATRGGRTLAERVVK